jgi:hypothetical protein
MTRSSVAIFSGASVRALRISWGVMREKTSEAESNRVVYWSQYESVSEICLVAASLDIPFGWLRNDSFGSSPSMPKGAVNRWSIYTVGLRVVGDVTLELIA